MQPERSPSRGGQDPRPHRANSQHRTALLFTAVLVVSFQLFVPHGKLVLYPLTLLSTWIHEMGHGVTALLCGGRFDQLRIYPDASGISEMAVPPGLCEAITAAGGLLAPPLIGALCLALGRRLSRVIMASLAVGLALSLVFYVRTWAGSAAILPLCIMMSLVASYGAREATVFLTQLLGMVLGLDTLTRTLGYLFVSSTAVWGAQQTSDIAGIAQVLGGPIWLWGGIIAAVALLLLALGILGAWRKPAAATTRADSAAHEVP